MPGIVADLLLLMVTLIWGTTFVLVKGAVSSIRPFTFLALRFFIGATVLCLCLAARKFLVKGKLRKESKMNPTSLSGSIITGTLLLLAYAFQTLGLLTVSAGKAAFITGLSVVIVPVASAALLKVAPGTSTWVGVSFALFGLGLMSLTLPLTIESGDVLVFLCALGFAAHILLVGLHSKNKDPVSFTAIQLVVVGAGSLGAALVFERPLVIPRQTWPAIVYTAIAATAFTVLLQSTVQKHTSATHTALIFSTEPVFAAVFAWITLGEILSPQEATGAVLILAGMVVSEIGPRTKKIAKERNC